MSSELMTPSEVAEAFRVDPKTVKRWADTGKLTVKWTLGGHRRYLRSEVEDAIRVGSNVREEPEGSVAATVVMESQTCPECGTSGLQVRKANPPTYTFIAHCGRVWVRRVMT